MSKNLVAAILLALTIHTFADEPILVKDNHRFYVKPDFAWNLEYTYSNESYTVSQRGTYYGMDLGYEYVKPNTIYLNGEAIISLGNTFAKVSSDSGNFSGMVLSAKNKAEGRVGYTFDGGFLSLFTGAGGYFLAENLGRSNIAFIPIGLRIDYRTPRASIGLKAEQMHYVYLWTKGASGEQTAGWERFYGYELSLPISFFPEDSARAWQGSFEPYYLYLFSDVTFIGGRLSATYQF